VRWETEWPFDGQLCLEYVYQKLLKFVNPSSSYGSKNSAVSFTPHCVVLPSLLILCSIGLSVFVHVSFDVFMIWL